MQWRFSRLTHGLLAAALLLLICLCSGGLLELVQRWGQQPEYGHGYFIPLVSLLLVWEQRHALTAGDVQPSWSGPIIVLVALMALVVGELSALFLLIQYAFVAALLGLASSLLGWQGLKRLSIPILLLLFAVPLPYFIEAQLTSNLQLLSSRLGVMFVRLWNIPVYVEGNLIDFGNFRLQVVDACSGLAYLYPMLGLGCICAYLIRGSIWKKFVLVVSTVPIAILLNSARIGLTGVLVYTWGVSTAEGFLHDFQGWAVFIAGVAILMAEMRMLGVMAWHQIPASSNPPVTGTPLGVRPIARPLLVSLTVLVLAAVTLVVVGQRQEQMAVRTPFADFPAYLGDWQVHQSRLDVDLVASLKLSDYLLADLVKNNESINLYIAYYASQRKGVSPHSPMVCMPGSGWSITDLGSQVLPLDQGQSSDISIRRAVVQKGDVREIMYYWYQERGHYSGNEYLMKWYLFKDALFSRRTDGALVRLRARVANGMRESDVDAMLNDFLQRLLPVLPRFLPP